MGLHKHEPVPDEAMYWISPKHSICQVLREIYWLTEDPEIRIKARLATSMAKAMTRKLVEYGEEFESNVWEKNPNYKKAKADYDSGVLK